MTNIGCLGTRCWKNNCTKSGSASGRSHFHISARERATRHSGYSCWRVPVFAWSKRGRHLRL